MTISVIIATYGRPERVQDLLVSLIKNTQKPDEVILVEQGDTEKLKSVTTRFSRDLNIKIIYQSEPSSAVARQTGVENSSGEVLVFLDDDMSIGEDYFEIAENYLIEHSTTLGLTGSYMKAEPAWTTKRRLAVLFGIYSLQKQNVILPSGNYDYIRGGNLANEQMVEWLYGGNMILRRQVFAEGFKFNHNFKKWSFGEDVMFSYKIHKTYPDSLRYLPSLEVRHHEGKENKILLVEAVRMKIVYRYIFWHQEVTDGSLRYTLAYLWSQVGLSALDLIQTKSLTIFKTQIKTYFYLFKNRKKIRNEQIDYNQFIFD